MERIKVTEYEHAVDYILSIPKFTKKNKLEDTKKLVEAIHNPNRKMKIIHVAGTNGKGSVCAYLRHILEAQGKRVGVFTSPHLIDIRERIMLAGQQVTKEQFLIAFQTIYQIIDPEKHPSFFEFLFLMSYFLFDESIWEIFIF